MPVLCQNEWAYRHTFSDILLATCLSFFLAPPLPAFPPSPILGRYLRQNGLTESNEIWYVDTYGVGAVFLG